VEWNVLDQLRSSILIGPPITSYIMHQCFPHHPSCCSLFWYHHLRWARAQFFKPHAWFIFYLHLHHADNTLTLDNITSFLGRLFASFCSPNLKTVPRHLFPSVPQRQKEILFKHANPQFSLLGLTTHEPHAFAPVQTRVHCLLHAPTVGVAFTSQILPNEEHDP